MRNKINGVALRALRLRKGFLIKDLSDKSGVSKAAIQKMESGDTEALQDVTLFSLAKGFDMNPADLDKILTGVPETVPVEKGREGDTARGDQP